MSIVLPSHRLLADGRLDLPEVTLVAATGKALQATVRALWECLAQIRPADTILFSHASPLEGNLSGIRHVRTSGMESREAYSKFIIHELAGHIETDFALCVQWDGYVLNAQNWSEEFLTVDYIGAPWPQFDDGHDVGNGGFSLRSRRLLAACVDQRLDDSGAEDIAICRSARPFLERKYGIRFADRDLARRFSYERTVPQGNEFGFHGAFNMSGIMPRDEFRKVVASLDEGILRRSDKIELLKCAIRRCDFGTARILLSSMLGAAPGQTRCEPEQQSITTRKMCGEF